MSATETRKRRGPTVSPEQACWYDMNHRCHHPTHPRYKDYGAKGIKVCRAWRDTTPGAREAFTDYMGPRPPGLVLGRPDTSKGYEPGNVAWMTRSEARRVQCNAVKVQTKDGLVALADLAEAAGKDPRNVRRRVQWYGWTSEDALAAEWPEYRRITQEQAKEIYAARRRKPPVPCRVLALKYGVSENLCSQIGLGVKWAQATGATRTRP